MRPLLPALVLVLATTAYPACAADEPVEPASAPAVSPSPDDATPTSDVAARPAGASPSPRSKALPRLRVRRVVTGIVAPWDVQRLPSGRLLVTERDRARLSTFANGRRRTVRFPSGRIWVSGETGLMSMEVDPEFDDNRRFYTCSGWEKKGPGHDIRVVAWRLNRKASRARRIETLVSGFPTSTSGFHAGCRLLIARDGSLVVSTGDAGIGSAPRNKSSFAGKTLRLNRMTGRPWPGNPFIGSDNPRRRYVNTFGHRNVQGLAQRRNGTLWSVEHGPSRDDEVNLLRKGGDYGWHPVPGYNQTVPMTDHGLPGKQRSAKWRSGSPTLATSGATWVYGEQWGRLHGTLAVAALKAQRVVFMKFGPKGGLKWTRAPERLRQLGRLRSVTRTPNGDLLLTTDRDSGNDAVLRVRARTS